VTPERAVAVRQAPAGEALVLGELRDKRRCRDVVERQDREPLPAVDADDDTRRPAAEASTCVVEQDRTGEAHRALSNPSRVARTSEPIVSST